MMQNKPVHKLIQAETKCTAATFTAVDFKMEMLNLAQRSTLQQVLSLLKLFRIMILELSSETRAPILKIVFIYKCIQQCSRQGTRPYSAKNMAPVAVANWHKCANSRNCQCWTQDLVE